MHRSFARACLILVVGMLELCAGVALAYSDICTYNIDCGCAVEFGLARQVRTRELTDAERQQVALCPVARFEYLEGAIGVIKAGTGTRQPLLAQPTFNQLADALDDLLIEVRSHPTPRPEFLDEVWARHKLAAIHALKLWTGGSTHPYLRMLSIADGYPPNAIDGFDVIGTYYRLVAQEPATYPEKIIFHLSRQDGLEQRASWVRLNELGSAGRDALLQLYHQGLPQSAGFPTRERFVGRLVRVLDRAGDPRLSELSVADMALDSVAALRSHEQAYFPVAPGQVDVRVGVAFMLSEASRDIAHSEARFQLTRP